MYSDLTPEQQEILDDLKMKLQEALEEYLQQSSWEKDKLLVALDPPLEYIQVSIEKPNDLNQG